MKEKIKTNLKIILIMFLIIFGILSYIAPNIYAVDYAEEDGGPTAEMFLEDYYNYSSIFTSGGIPYKLFAPYGISLWCNQAGVGITWAMTAPRNFKKAANDTSEGPGPYDFNNPLHYYKREGSLGLVYDSTHSAYYQAFLIHLNAARAGVGSPQCIPGPEPYKWTRDTAFVDSFHNRGGTYVTDRLTGQTTSVSYDIPTASRPVYSVKYKCESTLEFEESQRDLFILTQQKLYGSVNDIPGGSETLSEGEKEKGYFTRNEKQWAIWNDVHGSQTGGSRGLSQYADRYKEFFKAVYTGQEEDNYKDIVEVSSVDANTDAMIGNNGGITETVTDELDGDTDIKTYEYKDSIFQADSNSNSYLLGPFCIDYTFNDETGDVYKTTDGYELKFNALENIKVFNQDKKNIEGLGGSFSIVCKSSGNAENGKVHRINDEAWCEFADGAEIPGFTSRTPFYIIVHRGSMKAEDFKGFYIKIDFRYLEHVEGTIDRYEGHVYKYYYEERQGAPFTETLSGDIMIYKDVHNDEECECEHPKEECTYRCDCMDGHQCLVPHRYTWEYTEDFTLQTMIYELKMEETGRITQRQYGYHHDGKRVYKKYSIALKYMPEEVPPGDTPKFEFDKTCSQTGKALYGAKFNINIRADGVDGFGNYINKSVETSRITDINGKITLTSNYMESLGLVLKGFTGTVTVTLTETVAPAGHTIEEGTKTMTYSLTNGIISGATGNVGRMTVTDGHDNVRIQVVKLDKYGDRLTNVDAYFEIHVKYTNSAGELVDNKGNIIRGQTENGVLNLSDSNFANMPFGFNLNGYTGTVTLTIVEVATKSGYAISPDSKDITLRYEKGKLVDYTEYTNSKVLTEYLYDDTMKFIYDWAKSGGTTTLPSYIDINELNSWANEQMTRTGMKYEDVLGWLVEWFEEDQSRLEQLMERTTHMTTSSLGECVQIALEDEVGNSYYLPQIPNITHNDLFMVIAGTVFIDGTTQKGAGIVTDR